PVAADDDLLEGALIPEGEAAGHPAVLDREMEALRREAAAAFGGEEIGRGEERRRLVSPPVAGEAVRDVLHLVAAGALDPDTTKRPGARRRQDQGDERRHLAISGEPGDSGAEQAEGDLIVGDDRGDVERRFVRSAETAQQGVAGGEEAAPAAEGAVDAEL